MKKDASRFSPKGVLFHRTFFTAPIFYLRIYNTKQKVRQNTGELSAEKYFFRSL